MFLYISIIFQRSLIITLLLFGLVQSLLELKKENVKNSKRKIRKILSLLYICGFIIGILIVIIQERENKRINDLIQSISSSVTKIVSIDKQLAKVILVEDSLLTQYYKINLKLSKQVDLEMKKIEEKSPVIDLMDYDIKWITSDSISFQIEACIRNYGKRNAVITSGHGYVLFFNKGNKPFYNLDILGNNEKSLLEYNDLEHMRFCYYSFGTKAYKNLKVSTKFAIVYLEINYQDILMKKINTEKFYRIWSPTQNDFGGPHDWQIELAQKWYAENSK